MHDIDDFILPITTRSHTRASPHTVNEPGIMDNFKASNLSEDKDNEEGMTPLPPESVSDDASDPPAVVTTERTIDNSDPLTHTDITDSSNLLPASNNTLSDAVALPLISAKDYTDDPEFSGMYQYPVSYTHLTLPTIYSV